jgi:hypothetical protein
LVFTLTNQGSGHILLRCAQNAKHAPAWGVRALSKHGGRVQSIYQLDWKGPIPMRRDTIESMPDKEGIYLFSNSKSPFLIDIHMSCTANGDPSLLKPRILYIGMTTKSLRQRLSQHSIAQSFATYAELGDIYLYWLQAEGPHEYERRLISHIKPIFNRAFKNDVATNNSARNPSIISKGINELEKLIFDREESESIYQKLFIKYPFLLGGLFTSVQSHKKLDDENVPDFSAVRSKDDFFDIIEIKQPFLQLASENGVLRSEFNNAWNQAERYLDFARIESDYLPRQKGLKFENPYCYLIAGYKPCESLKKEITRKQRLNPGIIFLTYDEVLKTAKAYQHFINEISGASKP